MFQRRNSWASEAAPAAKVCAKCREPLGAYAVSTCDGQSLYHQSCFACVRCREPLTGPYVEVPPVPTVGRTSPPPPQRSNKRS